MASGRIDFTEKTLHVTATWHIWKRKQKFILLRAIHTNTF